MDAHIFPDRFQKMTVKLAVQVLSHSVNSKVLFSKNPYACALSETSTFVNNTLAEGEFVSQNVV